MAAVKGLLPPGLLRGLRRRFAGLEEDSGGHRQTAGRLFFNNAAGAYRLNSVLELQSRLGRIPDYPSRTSPQAAALWEAAEYGKARLRDLLEAPPEGVILQDLTASRLLFSLIEAAARVCQGDTLAVTALDHPAAIDGLRRAAGRLGKRAVVIPADQTTHSVSAADALSRLDRHTGLLVMTYTSNSTGAVLPVPEIARRAREINPEIYLIIDAVQKAPHGPVGLSGFPADAVVIAPYKMFSARGSGLAWCSERLSAASQDCLIGQSMPSWELGSQDPVSYALMGPVGDYFQWLGGHFLPEAAGVSARARIQEGLRRAERHERALLELLLEGQREPAGASADAGPARQRLPEPSRAQGQTRPRRIIPGLRQIPGLRLCFDRPGFAERDLILSFCLPGWSGEAAFNAFLEGGAVTSLRQKGSVYCGQPLADYGIDWLLRVSPMHYHGPREIRRFLALAREISGRAAQ